MTLEDRVQFYLEDVVVLLIEKHGLDYNKANLAVNPIWWYVSTGRASTPWCKALLKIRPFMIARRVSWDMSYDEVLNAIKPLVEKKMDMDLTKI